MRLIHTSDWHFGKNAPRIESYGADQEAFIDRLCALVKEKDASAVLVSGDIYDSAKVGADAIALYSRAASRLCIELQRDLVVTAGNHDSVERLTACDRLLEQAGLHIRGRLEAALTPVLLDGGRTAVYALPFFHPAMAAAVLGKPEIRTMTEAVTAVLDEIRGNMDPSRCNILMAHLAVTGAELSESDRTARNADGGDGDHIGGSSSVSASLFTGFDYVALGHIHKPQKLGQNFAYSGAPVAYSFGREEKQQKGVWLFDTETKESEFIPIPPLHGRKTVSCTCEEARALTGLEDTYLKLNITDRVMTVELRNELEQRFPLLIELDGMRGGEGGSAVFSAGEVKQLDPRDVLRGFLKDNFDAPLEDDLADLFMDCYEQALKED